MTVQISRNLVKFLSIVPHIALNSQENNFEMLNTWFSMAVLQTIISFKLYTKLMMSPLFKAFFRKRFTPDVALFSEKKKKKKKKKKMKMDILAQSKRFK